MISMNTWRSDYEDLWYNIKFELLKNWKRNRSIVAIIIIILTAVPLYLIPVIINTDFPIYYYEFLVNNMLFVNLILIMNAILFGSDALNGEHYAKTVLLIYPLPQRRLTVIIAKYLTQLITSWALITLYYAIIAIEVIAIYGFDSITADFIKSFLFSWLYMATLLAFAFLLSSTTKSPTISVILLFFSILLLFPIVIMLLVLSDIGTSWVFTNYSTLITLVFRFPTKISLSGIQTDSNLSPNFTEGIYVSIISLLIFLVVAIRLELRREI